MRIFTLHMPVSIPVRRKFGLYKVKYERYIKRCPSLLRAFTDGPFTILRRSNFENAI